MKAITLWQPWATLIAIGAKRIETRPRHIRHRGMIAIHAAKTWNSDLDALCVTEPFRSVLYPEIKARRFPFGAIVAVARLVDSVPIEILDSNSTRNLHHEAEHERAFGNYAPGRFGWLIDDVIALADPVPCRGYQSTPWTVDRLEEERVVAQLRIADLMRLDPESYLQRAGA